MDGTMGRHWLGIDVGGPAKGQALAVLDQGLGVVHLESGLAAQGLAQSLVARWGTDLVVGIDAPRRPAPAGAAKAGRACERALKKLPDLRVNPQWTPPEDSRWPPRLAWMVQGFAIFADFTRLLGPQSCLEVFPSASYQLLPPQAQVTWPLGLVGRAGRLRLDLLDAVCCALTVWCHSQGCYLALGREDEGLLILPWPPGRPRPELTLVRDRLFASQTGPNHPPRGTGP